MDKSTDELLSRIERQIAGLSKAKTSNDSKDLEQARYLLNRMSTNYMLMEARMEKAFSLIQDIHRVLLQWDDKYAQIVKLMGEKNA